MGRLEETQEKDVDSEDLLALSQKERIKLDSIERLKRTIGSNAVNAFKAAEESDKIAGLVGKMMAEEGEDSVRSAVSYYVGGIVNVGGEHVNPFVSEKTAVLVLNAIGEPAIEALVSKLEQEVTIPKSKANVLCVLLKLELVESVWLSNALVGTYESLDEETFLLAIKLFGKTRETRAFNHLVELLEQVKNESKDDKLISIKQADKELFKVNRALLQEEVEKSLDMILDAELDWAHFGHLARLLENREHEPIPRLKVMQKIRGLLEREEAEKNLVGRAESVYKIIWSGNKDLAERAVEKVNQAGDKAKVELVNEVVNHQFDRWVPRENRSKRVYNAVRGLGLTALREVSKIAKSGNNDAQQEKAVELLSELKGKDAIPELMELFRSGTVENQVNSELSFNQRPWSIMPLLAEIKEKENSVRLRARAIERIGAMGVNALTVAKAISEGDNPESLGLEEFDFEELLETIVGELDSGPSEVKIAAIEAIANLGEGIKKEQCKMNLEIKQAIHEKAGEKLLELVGDLSDYASWYAFDALCKMQYDAQTQTLRDLLKITVKKGRKEKFAKIAFWIGNREDTSLLPDLLEFTSKEYDSEISRVADVVIIKSFSEKAVGFIIKAVFDGKIEYETGREMLQKINKTANEDNGVVAESIKPGDVSRLLVKA